MNAGSGKMKIGACWKIKQLCASLSFVVIIASSHNEHLDDLMMMRLPGVWGVCNFQHLQKSGVDITLDSVWPSKYEPQACCHLEISNAWIYL